MSGKTPLTAAIRYALTRMKRLEPWLDHGMTELDNNADKRAMRPLRPGPEERPLRRLAER
ncbi:MULTISPECIES: IS66 family transposase [Hyphobacterium]|uniref:Transposase n=1 Tax=Hyphobacterium vulgare TaxID=1736751 RepID=A0ABV6ZX14_9PROT